MTKRKAFIVGAVLGVVCACGPQKRPNGNGNGGDGGSGGSGLPTCTVCTADGMGVTDCNGNTTMCADGMGCTNGVCQNACDAAQANHESVGCDYYAVDMDAASGPPSDACYTVFVANTGKDPVHIQASWNSQSIDLSQFAKLPVGTGSSLTYAAYNPATGILPGQVAILFLDYGFSLTDIGNVACPVPAALGLGVQVHGTGTGHAFHITTDNPVVAYQMLPYGGGKAAATGASLLIPTSAWDTNYIAVAAYDPDGAAPPIPIPLGPSHDIVALNDDTTVTMRPLAAIGSGGGLPAGAMGQNYTFKLDKGQYAQFTQASSLSGTPIQADQPVGVFGGHQIMSIDRCCGDHGEQMMTPVRALGSVYVAAPHADRKPAGSPDPRVFRIYGAVDNTMLTYDPPGVGPASVNQGQMVEIRTTAPFTVTSQDSDHPFSMFTYMTGAGGENDPAGSDYDPNWVGGWGDPDFVRLVPPPQYLSHYVFFTDVTYPFTTLTVVRQQQNGQFADVTLDCSGPITNWQPVGTSGTYQIAYVKLVDHFNKQGSCDNGVHAMDSTTPFGVWVWGWGSEDTNTGWVSYGYPAGEGVLPINNVIIM